MTQGEKTKDLIKILNRQHQLSIQKFGDNADVVESFIALSEKINSIKAGCSSIDFWITCLLIAFGGCFRAKGTPEGITSMLNIYSIHPRPININDVKIDLLLMTKKNELQNIGAWIYVTCNIITLALNHRHSISDLFRALKEKLKI